MTQAPLVLAIAGDDPGGQAGLARDREVLAELGCRAEAVLTARTAQDPLRPLQVWPEDAEVLGNRLHEIFSTESVAAVKIGMLATKDIAETVFRAVEYFDGPVVLDPVLQATSGLVLLEEEAYAAMNQLARRCSVVTPNLPEFERLGGEAWRLEVGAPVLVKGGHGRLDEVEDLLLLPNGERTRFVHPRRLGRSPRGTGCALSSAIAAHLASGEAITRAVEKSIEYLQGRFFSNELEEFGVEEVSSS